MNNTDQFISHVYNVSFISCYAIEYKNTGKKRIVTALGLTRDYTFGGIDTEDIINMLFLYT